jgi:hypothetical protein
MKVDSATLDRQDAARRCRISADEYFAGRMNPE